MANTAQWNELEAHFRHQATLVRRFERANAQLILRMWKTNRNEFGHPLSSFEREARTTISPKGSAMNDPPQNLKSPSRPTRFTAATKMPFNDA